MQGTEKFTGAFKSLVAGLVVLLMLWFKFIKKYTLRGRDLFFLGHISRAFSSTVIVFIFNFRLIFLETFLH